MSDARLRELERAAKAGDLDAHGHFLQEKLRQGSLNEEALEGLAHLLWPPAWNALGWQRHGHSGAPSESFRSMLFKRPGQEQLYQIYVRPERWVHGLRRWGAQFALRVGAAAARHRFPSWKQQYMNMADPIGGAAWEMPCELERIEVLLHMVDLHIMDPKGYPLVFWPGEFAPVHRAARGLELEAEGRALTEGYAGTIFGAFQDMEHEEPRITPRFAADLGIFAGHGNYEWLSACLQDSCDNHLLNYDNQELSWGRHVQRREFAVFEAIRNELVPWVLGDGDVVKDRVEENERSVVDRKQREA